MNYIPTGNEMISLPRINEANAAIEDFTFLHMGYKGLLDVKGTEKEPLMEPFIEVHGTDWPLEQLEWTRLNYWIPQFRCTAGPLRVSGTLLAPTGERGFAVHIEITNISDSPKAVDFGLRGTWGSTLHCVNEDKVVEGSKHCFFSMWNHNLIFDMRSGVPMFCFAPMTDIPSTPEYEIHGNDIHYSLKCASNLEPGDTCKANFYWGLGFEEVAAATSAKEMLRQGFDHELDRTVNWLNKRCLDLGDQKLNELYNTNLFFCIHFSTGITLDTEELVLVTSRSPRYYVSAAYWDRDSLLWSFPAILQADPALARKMLGYVFGRQRRNLGVHSRFIDGTVLEPGFELDELMAPVLALERYIEATGDLALAHRQDVEDGIEEILEKLQERRHPSIALYETFLQPTDDERVYPYITYDNVLVWKGLRAISRLYPAHADLAEAAEAVREAIFDNCVHRDADGAPYFAWSVDLDGRGDVYDEPPGSLQLLPFLGFCSCDDEIYCNTVKMIRSPQYKYSFSDCPIAEIGCPHAPHPWILSIANSLLCGRVSHCLDILQKVKMDNLIACESVDETTGECTTGEAFATCAGFLCYSLRYAHDIWKEQFDHEK